MEDAWITVARAPRRQSIDDLALLLASEGIPYRVDGAGRGWGLRVPLVYFGSAAAAFAACEADAPTDATSAPVLAAIDHGPSQVGTFAGLALLAFHALVALSPHHEWWIHHGRASAARIAEGELWRAVTALTLHGSPLHVASNAVACAVFGNLLGRAVGPGVAVALAVFAGALGNLLNNWWRGAPHLSLGASTAVFAIVGALAGLQAHRYRHTPALSRRAWVPLAGGVALLALLGSAQESDFIAHLCGLLAGMALGLLCALWSLDQLGVRVQRVAMLGSLLLVVGCWWWAW